MDSAMQGNGTTRRHPASDVGAPLFESPTVIGLLLDLEGRVQHFDLSFERLSGWRLDDARGKDWFATFLGERDRERVRALFHGATRNVPTRGRIDAIVTRRGEERAIVLHAEVIAAGCVFDGRPAIQVVLLDGTDQKRAEDQLRANQAMLAEAQRIARLGSWELDLGTSTLCWSDEIFRIFEIDPAQFDASYEAFLSAIHPDDRAAVDAAYTRSVAMREPYEIIHRLRMADGRIKHVHERCETRYADDGTPLRSLGTVQDITRQRQAEESLRETEERYHSVVAALSEGIVLQTKDGAIQASSESAARILGMTAEQMMGRSSIDPRWRAVHEDGTPYPGETHPSMVTVRTGRPVSNAIMGIHKPGGALTWLSVNSKAILLPGTQEPSAVVTSFTDITARKLAEDALQQSESLLRDAERIGRMGSWVWNIREDTARWSDELHRIFGLAPAALGDEPKRSFLDAVHPDDRVRLADIMTRAISSREPFSAEYRVIRPDGEVIVIHARGEVVCDAHGPVRMIGSSKDVTERKTTESALRFLSMGTAHLRGEALLQEVASQVAQLLDVEIGFVGRLLTARSPRIRTLGLCVDGQPMPPVEYDAAQTPCEVVIGKKALLVARDIQRQFPSDPRLGDLGASGYAAVPLLDINGNALGHVGVMSRRPLRRPEQVTALLQLFAVRTGAEIEREESAARFQDLFDFSPDAILMVDRRGLITMANRQAVTLFGHRHEELVGLPVEQLMPEAGRRGHVGLRSRFLSATRPRQMGSRSAPLFAQHKDGSTFPVDIGLSPMQSDDGPVVVAAVRDISERVRAEAERAKLEVQLRDARKMEAIGTLAGGIAHDFNNLLTVVVANVELARDRVAPGHPAVESLDDIAVAAARGTELVRQILAFSRKQPPQRAVVALRAVLLETAKMLRVALPAGIELAVHVDAATPNVLADPIQLQRVIMNLGTNARDALDVGPGRITIELDSAEVDETGARAHPELRPGHYARLAVSDTGKGMDAVTRERIFEPFFTTKEVGRGTGLGLAVVHGVVQAHGGCVTVDSRPGEGTTFTVHIPAADAESSPADVDVDAAKPGAAITRADGRRRHVLFLDDEPMLVASGVRLLERRGYRTTGFTRAADALAAIRSDPAAFDAVVTDFKMPDFSGLDVARESVRLRPGLPVVLMSGLLDEGVRADLLAVGVRYVLDKPWSFEQLAAILRELTA